MLIFTRRLLFIAIPILTMFLAPTQALGATPGVEFTLKGVLISNSSRSAFVNGKIRKEGERVDGIEILAIEESAVRVLSGTVEYIVPVGTDAYLQPSSVRSVHTTPIEHASVSPFRQVKSGDTLSEIAEDYAGDGVSLGQVIVALFEANPQAFDGDIHRLHAGAKLRIPETQEIQHHAAEADSYGPVVYGETLSEIAVEVAGEDVPMSEMMAVLFEANPHAFGESIDLLHEGAVLRVPDFDEISRTRTLTAFNY